MAKVYQIHDIELHPGVDEESFKKFVKDELAKAYGKWGWETVLLKGDRGQRAGKYAVLFESKSNKEGDLFSPGHEGVSEESRRWMVEHKELLEDLQKKWASFSPTDVTAHLEYTDYFVLE
jgi:hypothetical protein